MSRERLLESKDFVTTGIQLKLLNLIEDYMKENKINRTELAEQLSVTKGYVSQLLNASFDHKLSKFVELSLSCNAMPLVYLVPLDEYKKNDSQDKIYEIFPVQRARELTYESKNIIPQKNPTSHILFDFQQ